MKYTMQNTLKSGPVVLGLGLMLTTLSYAQIPYPSTQPQPHNVIYWNGDSTELQTLANSAYTDVLVNFITPDPNSAPNCYLSAGDPNNNGNLPGDIQSSIQTLHQAGKTVLVSFGNATSDSYQACYSNLGSLESQIETIVHNNGFDGVDIDFEDDSGFTGTYDGVDFLTRLTNDLYSGLQPTWQNIITHAPQAPYFTSDYNTAYNDIFANTYPNIAWFNLQSYNNNCPGSSNDCTATQKIADYQYITNIVGIPAGQLVMGVPDSVCSTGTKDDPCTGDGYIPLSSQDGNNMTTLISMLQQYYPKQFAGVMGWDYEEDVASGGTWGSGISTALTSSQPNSIWQNQQTGLCLDSDSYNSNWGSVYTDSCNTGNYQNWQFKVNTIVDAQTGFCLDSDIYGNVYTDSCNGGNYQNWELWGNVMINRQTKWCLDGNNGNVSTQPCNEGESQKWE
jgi:chitinase